MEPPQPPPPPPASPFDPNARPKTGGCPKPLIIGCLAVLVIGGLGLLGAFYYMAKNAGKVLQWSVTQMENGVMAQLPADVTQEERDRLRMAFANVTAGLKSGAITPDKFQPVQFKMLEIVRKKEQVTREDILELTRLLEETAAQGKGAGERAVPP
jgi:hypothetical protein